MSAKRYHKATWNQLGYLANWLPTAAIAAGDIGVWSAEGFSRVGTLRGRGIAFGTRHHEHPIDFTARASRRFEVVGAGRGAVGGHGLGVELDFAAAGKFVFQAGGCRTTIDGCESLLGRARGGVMHFVPDDGEPVVVSVTPDDVG